VKRCAALAFLLLGCGGGAPQVWMQEGIAAADDGDYGEALSAWTRSRETYQAFEGRVFVQATYVAPRFAHAHARFRAERDGRPAGEVRQAAEAAGAQARNEARFFVAVNTNDPYWNDLDRAQPTLKVSLAGRDGVVAQAKEIRRLTADEMADAVTYFPYATPLTRGYWLVFPLPEDHRSLRLRIAGPPALIDLRWETR
jgi:hypothetical protein